MKTNACVPTLLAFCLLACGGQKESATVNTETSAANSFVLDSLLSFDSEEAVIASFGRENISRDTAWLPEGMGQIMVTLLYPGTNNEVTFEWQDSATYSSLESVTVSRDSSQWSSRGVTIGTNLMELIELNGGDFTFSGFGWDYGGYAFFGDEGNLRGLTVMLGSTDVAMTEEEQTALLGDQQVTSSNDVARKNNPVVVEMKLIKERGD